MPLGASGGGDVFLICELSSHKCVSISYDAKFSVLIEAAGEEGLRFRQFSLDMVRLNSSHSNFSYTSQTLVGDVMRYLSVPTSHIVLTPYNMMLCCHRNQLSMVRHCTGRLIYETTLECVDINGAAFDAASDAFFISDSVTGYILCMQYMEFHKVRRLDISYTITPSGLSSFANSLLVPSKHSGEDYCGICYKLDDNSVSKISRVTTIKSHSTLFGRQPKVMDTIVKQSRPSTLNGIAVLPHAGSQHSRATMVAISEDDHSLYVYRVRVRKMKENSNQVNLTFRYKSREESSFTDRDGNTRLPRSVVAISSEFLAIYYETGSGSSKLQNYGIMLFRVKPP